MRYLICCIALLATLLCGCSSVKKAVKTFDNHSVDAAKYCASRFPVKEKVIRSVEYRKGDSIVTYVPGETVFVDCDSAVRATWDEASRKRIAVRTQTTVIHVTDTLRQVDTILAENSARVYALQADLSAVASERDKYKGQARTRGIGCAVLGVLLFIMVALFTMGVKGKL